MPNHTPNKSHNILTTPRKAIFGLFLFAIFIIAFYFRTVNLGSSPGWYSDEGNCIDLTENWLAGRWENYGVIGAPYIQRPPLYMYALSLAFRIAGIDITTARALTIFYSLISLLLVYIIVQEREGETPALLTAFIYAITPWIVAFNRFALSYNQMMPCLLLMIWAVLHIRQGGRIGWLWLGALASAAAALTDYLGVLVALVFLAALLVWKRKWLLPAFSIMIAGGLIGLLPILLKEPALFLDDTFYTLTHRTTRTAAGGTLLSLIINYGELLRTSSWILAALAGFFLLRDRHLKGLLLLTVGLTLLVVIRTYTPVGVGLHYLMHLFPLLAIGLAAFIQRGFILVKETFFTLFMSQFTRIQSEKVRQWVRAGLLALTCAVVIPPLIWMIFAGTAMFTFNTPLLFTGRDELYLANAEDANEARSFLKSHLTEDDLTLGSPPLIWGLPGKNADFMTALHKPLTSSDGKSAFIPISPDRIVYNSDYTQAAYIVFDKLALEFAPRVLPEMDRLIEDVRSNWIPVFQAGEILIYQNPILSNPNP